MSGWTGFVGTGEDARVYDHTGGGNALANTAADSADIGVGTFLLGDVRETVDDGNGGTKYKDYLVRRLADGNCWMVQNLDLNLANFTSDKTDRLTSDNTDVSEVWIPDKTLSDAGGMGNPSGTGYLEPGVNTTVAGTLAIGTYQFQNRLNFGPNLYWGSRYTNGTTTDNTGTANNNGLVIANNQNSDYPRSYNNDLGYITGTSNTRDPSGCAAIEGNSGVWDSKCQMPGSIGNSSGSKDLVTQTSDGLTQDSTWQPSYISTSDGATFTMRGSMYIGDYYNWYAATAGSGRYDMSNSTSHNGAVASHSICPKGWKLPVNGDSSVDGSWQHLINGTYGYVTTNGYNQNNRAALNKIMQLPLSIPFAGSYDWANGALNYRGDYGYYWSSTATSASASTYSYLLVMYYGGRVNPQDNTYKVGGFTIRCIAQGEKIEEDPVIPAQDTDKIATCGAGKICYDKNGGTGSMTDQSAASNSNVTLTASSFTKLGYAFAGWSTTENGFGGSLYGPNETITTGDLSSKGLTLYAKWLPSVGTMQNWTGCSTLAEHQTVALTDNRDGNVYTVAKLKDGNCWMTSNLALNLADFAGTTKLTSENTDIGNNNASNDAIVQCVQGDGCYDSNKSAAAQAYYWDPQKSSVDKFVALGLGTTQQYNFSAIASKLLGQSQPAQFLKDNQYCIATNNNSCYTWASMYEDTTDGNGGRTYSGSQVLKTSGETAKIDGVQRYLGINANAEIPRAYKNTADQTFFNWFAATAESGSVNSTSKHVEDSICPYGWSLPAGGDSSTEKSMSKLYYGAYNFTWDDTDSITALQSMPLNILNSGFIWGISGGFAADYTYLWSDMASDTITSAMDFRIAFSINEFSANRANSKANGVSIRCVKR